MSITPFAFSPPNGLRDASAYPTKPATESDARNQIQTPLDQVKNHLNNILPTDLSNTYASKTQENWIAPTLQNGWVNYGSPWADSGYMKDNLGFVHLKGLVKSGTTTSGTTIFTLPTGYRPLTNLKITVVANSGTGSVFGAIDIIASTGEVRFVVGGNTWFSFDGITFRAEQ